MASQKPIIYKKGSNILLESRRSPSPNKHLPPHCIVKSRSVSTNTDPEYKCNNCIKNQPSLTVNPQIQAHSSSFSNFTQHSLDPSWLSFFNSQNVQVPVENTKFEESDNSKVEKEVEMKKSCSESCREHCNSKSFTVNPYPYLGNVQHVASIPQNIGSSSVVPVFIPIYVSSPVVLNQDSLPKIESQTKCDRCCRKPSARLSNSQTTPDYFSSEDENESIKRGMKRIDKRNLIGIPVKIKNVHAKTDVSADESETVNKKIEKAKIERLKHDKYAALKKESNLNATTVPDHIKITKNNDACYKDTTSKVKQTKSGKKLTDDCLQLNKNNLSGFKKADSNSTEEYSENITVLSSAEIDENDTQDDNIDMSQQEILNRLIAPSTNLFNKMDLTRRRENSFTVDNIGAFDNFKNNEDTFSESQKQHIFDLNHNENNDQQEFNDAHSDRSQGSKADTVCDSTKQNAFTLLSFEEDGNKTLGKQSKEKFITMLSFLTQGNTDKRNLEDFLAQITNTTINEEKFEELRLNDEPNSSHKITNAEKSKAEIVTEKDHLGNLLPQSSMRKKSPPPFSKLRANSPTLFH